MTLILGQLQLSMCVAQQALRSVATYSKSRVDRAGRSLAEALRRAADGRRRVERERAELEEAIQIVDWWRAEHAGPLSRVAANLRHYAAEEGGPVVAQRLKKFPTIAGKLLREPRMKLSRMADIGGVRAVLPDQDAVYRVGARLRKNWTITKARDYIAEPKDDGYRALHLINRHRGRLIEIQLRTDYQDRWANSVEEMARELAPGLKFGGGPKDVRDHFVDLAEMAASLDQGRPVDTELLARLRGLKERVDTLEAKRPTMSPDEIQHFLVVLDPATGKRDVRKFGTDYETAQAAYAEAEAANGGINPTLDIVLLSADSLETIERTHSSYFGGEGKKLEELLPL
ncbi:MAG: RelA/SpoT domain-containing protein [Actinobacteria bacterium]|nr:RelA/SpoT domain-containing protein [Actinomycetota bacterium]